MLLKNFIFLVLIAIYVLHTEQSSIDYEEFGQEWKSYLELQYNDRKGAFQDRSRNNKLNISNTLNTISPNRFSWENTVTKVTT